MGERRLIALVVSPRGLRHVSRDAVAEVETAISADPEVSRVELGRAAEFAGRGLWLLRRAMRGRLPAANIRAREPEREYFSVLMGPRWWEWGPYLGSGARKSMYLFDAWPTAHDEIDAFARSTGVGDVFVSSSQVAAALEGRGGKTRYHWMPEGIQPEGYRARPIAERSIDVLQLGRRYDAYHGQIVDRLEQAGYEYVYEKSPGEIVFPSRESFVDGMARAKVSICVPMGVTHPERSGQVEVMTSRYLQSMASRCLVVGWAPQEMKDLFGYDPVIEIDMSDPAGQLEALLEDYPRYLPLIERNHQTVTTSHTWAHRWSEIRERLAQHSR